MPATQFTSLPAERSPAIAALPAELQDSAADLLSMILNGECSFAFVINWAERALPADTGADFINYVRSF